MEGGHDVYTCEQFHFHDLSPNFHPGLSLEHHQNHMHVGCAVHKL